MQPDQWTYVNTSEDFRPILDAPNQMYIVLSKFGKIVCAYPSYVFFDENDKIKQVWFKSCCGVQGNIYSDCTPVLAYKSVGLTEDLLDIVNSTKKGQASVLSRAYSQECSLTEKHI